jgi:hypothetical protein
MSKLDICKYWQITKHKGLEIQLTNWRTKSMFSKVSYPNFFKINFEVNHPTHFDHPGVGFSLEILGIYFHIDFHDNRHQDDISI